jgi:EmrB/QacA subfamily drug resistance transporter
MRLQTPGWTPTKLMRLHNSPVPATLRVIEGADTGMVVSLAASTVLGRDDSADVALADEEISRRHLRVVVSRERVVLEDLGSSNGTFVNGARIVGAHTPSAGDQIRIGKTVLEFTPDPELAERTVLRPVPRAAADQAIAELRVIRGPGAGESSPLTGTVQIGREADCDLVLPDEEVSRHHAEVTPVRGEVAIEDLRSTNGTFLNGERMLERATLQPGDLIQVGSAVIEFSAPSPQVTRVRRIAPEVTAMRQVIAHPQAVFAAETGSRKWWTLLVVCAGVFMLLLDTLIVSVALTPISQALHPTFTQLQWVIDAYSLMLAAMLLTAGSLSDIFGRRTVFAIGLTVFTASSVVCGLSSSATMLDLARAVQGIGGAMAMAPSLGLLAQEFPEEQRGLAFGVWGATTGAAVAFGPLIGGLLIGAFSWQAVFYVNVPIGIVTIFLCFTKLVNLPGPETSIDWPGLATFTAGSFMLVFALIRGNEEGWTSALILVLLVGSVAMFAMFVLAERRAKQPMLDLNLLRKPTFDGASVAVFGVSASITALVLYMTLWLESIEGFSALGAGLRMLPLTAMMMLFAPVGGKLSEKVPPRLLIGGGIMLIGVGIGLMTVLTPSSSWTVLLPGLVVCGIGMGISAAPIPAAAVSVVPNWRAGMAGGANSTFRQLGLATGIAALGAIFLSHVRTHVANALVATPVAHSATKFANLISAGGTPQLLAHVPPSARPALQHAAVTSFTTSLTDIFAVAAVIALVAGVASAVLIRPQRPQDAVSAPGAEAHAAVG